jgi:Domain of unknown function (DUF6438)
MSVQYTKPAFSRRFERDKLCCMNKLLIFFAAFILIFSVAAKRHKKKRKESDVAITSVMLYHGGCYGRCPIYSVQLDKNGTVTYHGIRFVPDTGVYRKVIGKNAALRTLHRFEEYRVDTCKRLYQATPDVSSFNVTVAYTDSIKQINNASFGPAFLSQLAAAIDSLKMTDTIGWRR